MPAHYTQQQLQHFEHTCKSAGLKVTQQRLEIYTALLEARNHPSAEALHHLLAGRLPALSLDTVYRTLATLEKLHLVHRLETPENQARYEALGPRHHHFLCDRCGQVIDFVWQSFDAVELPQTLAEIGTIDRTSVIVHGKCAACLQAESENAAS